VSAESTQQITYRQLLELHVNRLQSEDKSESTINNAKSTLNDWLRIFNLDLSSVIGKELYSYEDGLNRYLKALIATGKSKDSLRPTKSILSKVHETFEQWRYHHELPPQFGAALNILKEQRNISWKKIAELALGDRTKDRKIKNWAQGVNMPRKDSLREIRLLEKFLEVPEKTLVSRLPRRMFGTKTEKALSWVRSAWGDKQAAIVKNKERIKFTDWPRNVEKEFEELIISKSTSRFLADDGNRYPNNKNWRFNADNVSPTSVNVRDTISHYFGFLVYHAPTYLKVDPEKLSLSLLVDFTRVEAWIYFTKKRSDNTYNGFTEKQLNLVKMLTRPNSGFLWANKRFQNTFLHDISDWRAFCEKTWTEAKEITYDIRKEGDFKKTRNPRDVLAPLLSQQKPIMSLFELIDEHDKERPLAHQSDTKHASWYRDEILLHLLVSCPLRMSTLAQLEYRQNGGGSIQRHKDGSWHLVIPSNAFKNEHGAAKEGYKAPLPNMMWKLLDEYVEKYRHILLRTYDDHTGVEHDFFLNNANMNAYKKHGPPRTM